MFNLRLTPELQEQLKSEATRRGVSRSDVARVAIEAYLAKNTPARIHDDELTDEWSDLGAKVINAQRFVLHKMLDALDDPNWEGMVEPIYALFRQKTIAKTRTYETPSIFSRARQAPFDPYVVAAIGFASDDIHEIKVSLEQLLFEYCWSHGDAAFEDIYNVMGSVKARVDAHEAQPTREASLAARETSILA